MGFSKILKILKVHRERPRGILICSILITGTARTSSMKFSSFRFVHMKISKFQNQRSQELLMGFSFFMQILNLQRKRPRGILICSILITGTAQTSYMKFLSFRFVLVWDWTQHQWWYSMLQLPSAHEIDFRDSMRSLWLAPLFTEWKYESNQLIFFCVLWILRKKRFLISIPNV